MLRVFQKAEDGTITWASDEELAGLQASFDSRRKTTEEALAQIRRDSKMGYHPKIRAALRECESMLQSLRLIEAAANRPGGIDIDEVMAHNEQLKARSEALAESTKGL